eukprot:scaffold168_cov53-Attheya_sp.AAC.6
MQGLPAASRNGRRSRARYRGASGEAASSTVLVEKDDDTTPKARSMKNMMTYEELDEAQVLKNVMINCGKLQKNGARAIIASGIAPADDYSARKRRRWRILILGGVIVAVVSITWALMRIDDSISPSFSVPSQSNNTEGITNNTDAGTNNIEASTNIIEAATSDIETSTNIIEASTMNDVISSEGIETSKDEMNLSLSEGPSAKKDCTGSEDFVVNLTNASISGESNLTPDVPIEEVNRSEIPLESTNVIIPREQIKQKKLKVALKAIQAMWGSAKVVALRNDSEKAIQAIWGSAKAVALRNDAEKAVQAMWSSAKVALRNDAEIVAI